MATALSRSFVVWIVIILVETVHGIVRNIFIALLFGDLRSRQIGVFVGSVLIFLVAYLLICWTRAKSTAELFAIGAGWVVLTILSEVSLGKLAGFSNERILEDYDLTNGGLMAFGLVFLLFSPLLARWLRKCRET